MRTHLACTRVAPHIVRKQRPVAYRVASHQSADRTVFAHTLVIESDSVSKSGSQI